MSLWFKVVFHLKQLPALDPVKETCMQCGLPPGRQVRMVSDDPFLHPHRCQWCRSVLYVPGLMVDCSACKGHTDDRLTA